MRLKFYISSSQTWLISGQTCLLGVLGISQMDGVFGGPWKVHSATRAWASSGPGLAHGGVRGGVECVAIYPVALG